MDEAAAALGELRNGNVKLTQADADYIRQCEKSNSELARDFGVSWQTIDNVRKGRTWRNAMNDSIPTGIPILGLNHTS